jgi:type IV secretory pathway VirJ component
MFRSLAATIGILALLGAAPARAQTAAVDGLTLGRVEPIEPPGEPRGLVFLFSGEDGLTPAFRSAAEALARDLGVIVAPVDLPPFLARQSALGRDCLYLVSALEEVSQRIQVRLNRGHYLTPIVAGTGMGSAVAYGALAQAPDATLDGAAGDGFATRIATKKPLCAGAPVEPAAEGGFRYGPSSPLPGWWRVAVAEADLTAARAFAAAVGADADAAVVEAPAGSDLQARLELLLAPPLEAEAKAARNLNELPLVELPVSAPGRLMAVVYSGDGGWRDIDKEIAGRLQAKGIPVVGVDSLRYFWSEKTPERIAADLTVILDHYRDAWARPDVVLVGYSFGADVLPFAYNRLAPEWQRTIRRVALLGLAPTADMVIRVAGWLGIASDGLPTAPELARLPAGLVQCFYGAEEADTACTSPALEGAELVRTAGGHHFDGNYEALADAIIAGAAAVRP